MKKIYYLLLCTICSIVVLGSTVGSFGIVYDEDFKEAGVEVEKLAKAKVLMEKTSLEFKKLTLDKQQLELNANQYILDGVEKNLEKLDKIFDNIGIIEAKILKSRIRSQVEMFKYITRQQYVEARKYAVERIKKEQQTRTELEEQTSLEILKTNL
ncbi:MAG: hypothetical protein ACRC6K_04990 [Fusobacteriaceae bacterium]